MRPRPPFRLLMAFALALVCSHSRAHAAPTPRQPAVSEEILSRLDAMLERLDARRAELHVPGLAIAIVKGDRVVLARGMGVRDIEAAKPVEADTIFAIGSSTKSFTAALLATLVEEGKVAWDDPVRTHLPTFALHDAPAGEACTLRDLLTHRTGLVRLGALWAAGKSNRLDVLSGLARAEAVTPFRSSFNYCNEAFLAAGLAAGAASGSDYDTLIRTRFFQPLRMTSTSLSIAEVERDARLSRGYRWLKHENTHRVLPMRNLNAIAPAGAVNSNILDMTHWLIALLNEGSFEGRRVLSKARLDEMWTPQIEVVRGSGLRYGLGWMLGTWNGKRVVDHGGNIDGFASTVALLPDEKIGFCMFQNVTASPLQEEVKDMVWQAMLPGAVPPMPADAPTREQLSAYLGKYRFDLLDADVTVLIRDGQLAVDVPGQTVYTLRWPDTDGRWAFALTDSIKIAFNKNETGDVLSLTFFQAGAEMVLPKAGAPQPAAADAPGVLPAEQIARLAGIYRFAPAQQDWRVESAEGRLVLKAPGQPTFKLRPVQPEGRFAFEGVKGIEVAFTPDEGKVASMTLFQAGQAIDMPRVGDVGSGNDGSLPTLDEVMALGGRDRAYATLEALGGVRLIGSVNLPNQGVNGTADVRFAGLDRYLITLDFGVFGRNRGSFDNGVGWAESVGEPLEQPKGEQLVQLRLANPAVLLGDFRRSYDEVTVVRRQTIDGKDAIVLRMAVKGLPPAIRYLSAADGTILREESATLVEDFGSLPQTVEYADYRPVGGVNVPFSITVRSDMTGRTEMRFERALTGKESLPPSFSIAP
ncbi:MAG: serine hydrolase [Phycisphaerae bacterium]|nr:serine hydrolase [Phycisphaerae bacterium]